MSPLQQKLRTYIVDNLLFGQNGQLRDQDSFIELGIMDSTGVLELVSYLEEEYSIAIEEGEIAPENLDSIERLTCFVTRKRAQAGEPLPGERSAFDRSSGGGES